jgi:hypothetical protein
MPVFIVSLPLVGRDQGWGWATRTERAEKSEANTPPSGEGMRVGVSHAYQPSKNHHPCASAKTLALT